METVTLNPAQEEKVVAALSQTALFRALKPDHFPQLLKAAEVLQFSADEAIISKGDPSDSFYVLVDGQASIRIRNAAGEESEVGRVPVPSSVGEIGLLLDEPRTASIVAIEPVKAVKFGSRAFQAMFQKIPEFGMGLSRGLAFRLAQVSSKVPLPEWDRSQPAPSQETLSLLPHELCQRHRVLPLAVHKNVLTLGVVDDPRPEVMGPVRDHVAGMELRAVRLDASVFDELMRTHSGVSGWASSGAPAEIAVAGPSTAGHSATLDALLRRMIGEGASDLHLTAGHKPHWRINGDMFAIADAPALGVEQVLELLTPGMEERHKKQFAEDSDVDFAYSLDATARFRVNVFRDRHGVGAVMRLIPTKVLTLEQLALPPVVKNFCEIPKGLVLVTGPTGSGKSTTLAAMIDYINRNKKAHIISLEDPIEFVHESQASVVNQREVGGHTKSFARALKAALREDPNVVLVGEMRDLETIALALETANTGHLVFATLHTNSAVSAVDRIVDQFPAGQQAQIRSVLGDVLRGVVAQTLVKKIGGGRLAILEILVVNLAISNLIREAKTVQIPSLMQAGKGVGMTTLNDELGKLVEAKKIELDEALTKAIDKDGLLMRFRSGVTLAAEPGGGSFRVMNVNPDSPGATADLHRGDVIVELNTKPSSEYTLDDMRQYFRTDGKHLLVVERGGKRIKITLELKR